MALENADGNYFRITDISIDPSGNFSGVLTAHVDAATRSSSTEFDATTRHNVGGTLETADIEALLAAVYAKIKLSDEYSSGYTDV